jgi:hypothetical protein
VESALAKDPQSRPTAPQLLDRLTSAARRPERIADAPTQVISSQAPAAPAPDAPGNKKVPIGHRIATMAASAIVAIRRRRPGRRAAGPPGPKG